MSQNKKFCDIGKALYGDTYKKTLAQRLGVANGVVTRMCKEGETIKPHYWVKLEEIHHERIKELHESLNNLKDKSPN